MMTCQEVKCKEEALLGHNFLDWGFVELLWLRCFECSLHHGMVVLIVEGTKGWVYQEGDYHS